MLVCSIQLLLDPYLITSLFTYLSQVRLKVSQLMFYLVTHLSSLTFNLIYNQMTLLTNPKMVAAQN